MTVRQMVAAFVRGAKQGPKDVSREAVVELIQQSAASQSGMRKGWQVKAASWVKKVHVDRGDVKIGRMERGRFQVQPHLLPRYFVPENLETFELKPYVEVEAPPKKPAAQPSPQ
ncbi:hypothetical protein TSOC_009928 [Tetrabaena socialis]|uniref:Uncharacterized protein n=1 Tax=Tetrabaena socialis TaxID=47790 RepID=A0A2J7ZUJ6_9CHLO|nr:hypothetical protein TSOC_009928 [Tetrabaena socialis]|eukprot:PNH03944.1 hypothetical protein TSOC_009928 [Tetrabaena socialis]